MVLGSVLTVSSALSSSAKPFLNDLMPLAKSPISSEILPRPPNSRSTTAPAMIQCQMLSEPMSLILRADGPHGPWGHTGPLGGTESRPAMRQKQGLQKMPSFRGAPRGASPEPIATAAVWTFSPPRARAAAPGRDRGRPDRAGPRRHAAPDRRRASAPRSRAAGDRQGDRHL